MNGGDVLGDVEGVEGEGRGKECHPYGRHQEGAYHFAGYQVYCKYEAPACHHTEAETAI